MKKYIAILYCSFSFSGISQNLKSDHSELLNNAFENLPVTEPVSKDSAKKEKSKLFELDSAKLRHSVDLRYIYDITLGYNFSYYFLPKRLGIGIRAGMWYKKKENYPGGIYSRYGIKFSGDLYFDITLWRSISVQMGVTFQNDLTWPSKENPVNDSGKLTNWGANIYLKPTFIFYKHYMISAGVSYSTFEPYKYFEIRPVVSVGYKF